MSKGVSGEATPPAAEPMDSRLFVVRAPLHGPDGAPTGEYHYVLTERVADLHQGRIEPGMANDVQAIANSLAALFAAGPQFEAVAVPPSHDTGGHPDTLFASLVGGNASA
jgi:hypothetical protein